MCLNGTLHTFLEVEFGFDASSVLSGRTAEIKEMPVDSLLAYFLVESKVIKIVVVLTVLEKLTAKLTVGISDF